MSQPGKPGGPGTGEPALPDSAGLDTLPDGLRSGLAHLFDYCHALLGQDAKAARTARAALDSAHAAQQDPDRLRAGLFASGRRQALALRPPGADEASYLPLALVAVSTQQADNDVLRAFRALSHGDREIVDLVYRHGIRAADLPEVLGIPAAEAYRRLAVAEGEFVSLLAEPPGSDAAPAGNAGAKLEDIAALPLAALPAWQAPTATRLPHGESRSRRRRTQFVTAAVISAAAIGAAVYLPAAGHPTGSHAATLAGNGARPAGQRAGTPSPARAGRSARAGHRPAAGQPVSPWVPVDSQTATSNPSGPVITQFAMTVNPVPCPAGTKANFRWHYSANGSAGGWSGTATHVCPGSLTMGPQAMGGNMQLAPGTTLQAGYDFTLPGNKTSLSMTVSAAQVTFAVTCGAGAAPSAPTITVPLQAQTYQITGAQWYPSGDQSSPLVYQGSVRVPALCGPAGKMSLARGGTFTASLG